MIVNYCSCENKWFKLRVISTSEVTIFVHTISAFLRTENLVRILNKYIETNNWITEVESDYWWVFPVIYLSVVRGHIYVYSWYKYIYICIERFCLQFIYVLIIIYLLVDIWSDICAHYSMTYIYWLLSMYWWIFEGIYVPIILWHTYIDYYLCIGGYLKGYIYVPRTYMYITYLHDIVVRWIFFATKVNFFPNENKLFWMVWY